MIKKVSVPCARCNQVSELYLSADANIIIFNCPSCWAPLLSFRSSVYMLSEVQLNEVKCGNPHSAIRKILKSIGISASGLPSEPDDDRHGAEIELHAGLSLSVHPAPGNDDRRYISADDILNLRIELAMSNDVREFLARLG